MSVGQYQLFKRQKNKSTYIVFSLIDSDDSKTYFTGTAWCSLTNASITAYSWRDGDTPNSLSITSVPQELGSTGIWYMNLSASNTNPQSGADDYIIIKFNADEINEQGIRLVLTENPPWAEGLTAMPVKAGFDERTGPNSQNITRSGHPDYGAVFTASTSPSKNDYNTDLLVGALIGPSNDQNKDTGAIIIGGYYFEDSDDTTDSVFGVALEDSFGCVEGGSTLINSNWTGSAGMVEAGNGSGWTFITLPLAADTQYPSSDAALAIYVNQSIVHNNILKASRQIRANKALFKNDAGTLSDVPFQVEGIDNQAGMKVSGTDTAAMWWYSETSPALLAENQTGSSPAAQFLGNSANEVIQITGGREAIKATAGSGYSAAKFEGNGTGHGIEAVGGATNGHGFKGEGQGTGKDFYGPDSDLGIAVGTVDANLVSIDGQLTNGNNATLNLKQLNVQNATGEAIYIETTDETKATVKITGNSNDASNGTVSILNSNFGFEAVGVRVRSGVHGRAAVIETNGGDGEIALDVSSPHNNGIGMQVTGSGNLPALKIRKGNGADTGDLVLFHHSGSGVTNGINFTNSAGSSDINAKEIGAPGDLGSGASLADNLADVAGSGFTSSASLKALKDFLGAAGVDLGDGTTIVNMLTGLAGKTANAGSYDRANDSQEAIRDNSVSLTNTVDGVTLESIYELILALVNGRFAVDTPAPGQITFYKRDNSTTLTVVDVDALGRTRIL